VGNPLIPGKLDRQMVLGALKATGSSDPDVLYARKEELLGERKGATGQFMAWALIVLGVVMTLMVITAPVGIPALIYGVWLQRRLTKLNGVAETTFTEYLKSIGVSRQAAST